MYFLCSIKNLTEKNLTKTVFPSNNFKMFSNVDIKGISLRKDIKLLLVRLAFVLSIWFHTKPGFLKKIM